MEKMTSEQMLKMLKKETGTDFDHMFLKHMIHHHKSGIQMARLATKKSTRSKIQKMAQKMVDKQSEEIEKMREML